MVQLRHFIFVDSVWFFFLFKHIQSLLSHFILKTLIIHSMLSSLYLLSYSSYRIFFVLFCCFFFIYFFFLENSQNVSSAFIFFASFLTSLYSILHFHLFISFLLDLKSILLYSNG